MFGFHVNAQENKPNVIVILTDDQGYGDMSCHGNPWLKTPETDKLHDESLRLTDFHVDPTCAPTRASLMTGRYATRTGVWLTYGSRHHLRKDEITMADVFKSNGYKTAIFGKWHLGDNYPFRPSDRGFDEALIHGGGVIGESPDYWDNDYYNDTYFRNNQPEKVEGYCTDVWFNETQKFIKSNEEKPFFVYLATNAPHGPLHVPIKYAKSYLDNPETKPRARFYGMIASIDENLGKLRTFLKEEDLDRKTIIVYLNDNGTIKGAKLEPRAPGQLNGWAVEGYNAGLRGIKTSRYEGGHKGACFIHYPNGNMVGGKDVNGLSAHLDLLPTLMDVCDLKYEKDPKFDGISLLKYLNNPEEIIHDRMLVVHDQGRFGKPVGDGSLIKGKDYAVMYNQWRLVQGNELYNIKEDPSQKNNIADKHPEMVKQLQDHYEVWWQDVAKQANEYCSFIINPEKQKVVTISSQNLLGGQVAYSQRVIRSAKNVNGYTYIDVEVPGTYKISLARWARESYVKINDVAKPFVLVLEKHDAKKILTKAIHAVKAKLQVGDFNAIQKITGEEQEIVFEVDLPKGEQKIQTWFELKNGETITSYYTYIEQI
ncbi:arylsulfatase [Flavivirga amylovorans]